MLLNTWQYSNFLCFTKFDVLKRNQKLKELYVKCPPEENPHKQLRPLKNYLELCPYLELLNKSFFLAYFRGNEYKTFRERKCSLNDVGQFKHMGLDNTSKTPHDVK